MGYGVVTKSFDEYLKEWNEPIMENDDDMDSMNGADVKEMVERKDTLKSVEDSALTSFMSPSPPIREDVKEPLFNITKENITQKNIFDQERPYALSTYNADGHVDMINISGPKQMSVFDALSTAPQVGFAPIVNKK